MTDSNRRPDPLLGLSYTAPRMGPRQYCQLFVVTAFNLPQGGAQFHALNVLPYVCSQSHIYCKHRRRVNPMHRVTGALCEPPACYH